MLNNDTEIATFIIDELKSKTSFFEVVPSPDCIHYDLFYRETRMSLVVENGLVTMIVHSLGNIISPSDQELVNKLNTQMFLSKVIINSNNEIKMLTSTIKTNNEKDYRLFVKYWIDEMAVLNVVAEGEDTDNQGGFFSMN